MKGEMIKYRTINNESGSGGDIPSFVSSSSGGGGDGKDDDMAESKSHK